MYSKKSEKLAERYPALSVILERIDSELFKHRSPTFRPKTIASFANKSEEQAESALRLLCTEGLLSAEELAVCGREDCGMLNELEGNAIPKECSSCGEAMFSKERETVYRLSPGGAAEKENVLVGLETSDWPRSVSSYRGKVDAVIVSIKQEEFEAVVKLFTIDTTTSDGLRHWNMCRVWSEEANRNFRVAIVRANEQGNIESYAITRDAIQDLEPACVLVVGIGGAAPGDVTLGDVIFGSYVHNLNCQDVKSGGRRSFSIKGGAVARGARNALANLPVSLPKHLKRIVLPELPPIDADSEVEGSEDTVTKVRERLLERCGNPPTQPSVQFFKDGEIASSDTLVRYSELVDDWRKVAKHILCVDMESAGACKAAEGLESTAVIPIRAMSDVIGLQRDDKWTLYACDVAARVALAFIKSWAVVPSAKS